LAEDISPAAGVIFLDARRGEIPGELFCQQLDCRDIPPAFTHTLTPTMLLAYARGLYGRSPRAFLVSVTGQEFGFSTELTPPVQESILPAVTKVKTLIEELKRSIV
jgi:Ni,Fe-hydrogenase maturation factor